MSDTFEKSIGKINSKISFLEERIDKLESKSSQYYRWEASSIDWDNFKPGGTD